MSCFECRIEFALPGLATFAPTTVWHPGWSTCHRSGILRVPESLRRRSAVVEPGPSPGTASRSVPGRLRSVCPGVPRGFGAVPARVSCRSR